MERRARAKSSRGTGIHGMLDEQKLDALVKEAQG
jgi:hypothetical protein